MVFACIVTVGLIYALFGKTTSVTTPQLGSSSETVASLAASSSSAVTSSAPSTTALVASDPPSLPASTSTSTPSTSGSSSSTTALVASDAPPPVPTTSVSGAGSTTSSGVTNPVQIAIIGDTYTAPSPLGGQGTHNWTAIVDAALVKAGYDVKLDVDAVPGSGYVRTGDNGSTYFDAVNRIVTPATTVVVVFGSRYDDGLITSGQVGTAAAALIVRVHETAPKARVLLIAPPWVDQNVPSYISGIELALKADAGFVDTPFVDPIADRWFVGDATLIGSDGITPTDAGHAYMAARILPAIEVMLPSP